MPRILVVDDNETMRDVMEDMLTIAGYAVHACSNGTEAASAVSGTPFDLAVVDMVMPDEDGFITVEKLLHAQPEIKIIGISGGDRSFDGSTYLDIVRKRGAHCTLAKPFDREMFLAAVGKLLEPQ